MKKILVVTDDRTFGFEIESEQEVKRYPEWLEIFDTSGNLITFNRDEVLRYLIADADSPVLEILPAPRALNAA